MANVVSRLVIALTDQFSKPAKDLAKSATSVEDALKGINRKNINIAPIRKDIDGLNKTFEQTRKATEKMAAGPMPFSGFSKDLKSELRQMNLTRAQIRSLSREFVKLQTDQAKALAGIANPKIRAQIIEKDLASITDKIRRRAREIRELNHLTLDVAGPGRRRGVGFGGSIGGIGTAYAAQRAGRYTFRTGAEAAREGARDYTAGLTEDESARIKARSLELSQRYRSVDATTFHERLRDTAMSMGSVDKAFEVSDAIGKATVVLQAMKGKEAAIEEGRRFFAALDNLGKNVDPEQIVRLTNGWIKALGVEGADLNMAGLHEMAKTAKSGGTGLSDKFLMTTAPSLMMDMSPSRLGTALGSEVAQIIGGRATAKSKQYQIDLGMRDRSGRFSKADRDLITSDPYEYSVKRLIPMLKRAGIDPDDKPAVVEALSKAFSNQMVADLFAKMITQREQYDRKRTQYDKAPGLDAAESLNIKDPLVAAAGAVSQFNNLIEALTNPLMPAATGALNAFSGIIGRITATLNENPTVAAAAGAGTAAAVGAAGLWGISQVGEKGWWGGTKSIVKGAGSVTGRVSIPLAIGGVGYAVYEEAKRRDPNGDAFGLNPEATRMRQEERTRAAARKKSEMDIYKRNVPTAPSMTMRRPGIPQIGLGEGGRATGLPIFYEIGSTVNPADALVQSAVPAGGGPSDLSEKMTEDLSGAARESVQSYRMAFFREWDAFEAEAAARVGRLANITSFTARPTIEGSVSVGSVGGDVPGKQSMRTGMFDQGYTG